MRRAKPTREQLNAPAFGQQDVWSSTRDWQGTPVCRECPFVAVSRRLVFPDNPRHSGVSCRVVVTKICAVRVLEKLQHWISRVSALAAVLLKRTWVQLCAGCVKSCLKRSHGIYLG